MDLLDRLAILGDATTSIWASILIWTVVAAAVAGLLRLAPKRLTALHHDSRVALLLALPLSLVLGAVAVLRSPEWLPTVVMQEVIVGRGSSSLPAVDVLASPGAVVLGLLTAILLGGALLAAIRIAASMVALSRLLGRAQPISFQLNGVIDGWTEGLQLMSVGSNYKFYIPYQLGYGEGGAPGAIPPFCTLMFEVELLDIK